MGPTGAPPPLSEATHPLRIQKGVMLEPPFGVIAEFRWRARYRKDGRSSLCCRDRPCRGAHIPRAEVRPPVIHILEFSSSQEHHKKQWNHSCRDFVGRGTSRALVRQSSSCSSYRQLLLLSSVRQMRPSKLANILL